MDMHTDMDMDDGDLDEAFQRSHQAPWRATRSENEGERQPIQTGLKPNTFYSHHHEAAGRDERLHYGIVKKDNENAQNAALTGVGSRRVVHYSSKVKRRNQLENHQGMPVAVHQVIAGATERLVQQKRQDFLTDLKLQRSAYRDALVPVNRPIQLYALQQPALENWTQRMQAHLHLSDSEENSDLLQDSENPATSMLLAMNLLHASLKEYSSQQHTQDVSDLSSPRNCDASSVSSVDEPKRVKRDRDIGVVKEVAKRASRQSTVPEKDISPTKSSKRSEHKHTFQREAQSLSTPPECLPPLWCMEPRLFSKELSSTGKRAYVASSYGRFVDYYWRKCLPANRHYYELIRDETPCRLYFDLEFHKGANREIADNISLTEDLMTEFISELSDEIQSKFGSFLWNLQQQDKTGGIVNPYLKKKIYFSRKNIVDLDSSTPKKFSRHLIVHLPCQALSANTFETGFFVKNFVGRLAEEQANGLLLKRGQHVLAKYLMVNPAPPKKEGELVLLVLAYVLP
jgi:hypothetical protein